MFNKILLAMQTSITYTSLDVKRLSDGIMDFIKCISLNKLTDDELDGARYFTRNIKPDIVLMYIFLDTDIKKDLLGDVADRMGKKYIILYNYLSENMDDAAIIIRLREQAIFILKSLYNKGKGNRSNILMNFNKVTSEEKLIILAPYIIVCKIFDKIDIGLYTGGNFIIQEALNPDKVPQIDEEIKFILTEHPDMDTLFNLNGFLLPFAKK